jgi:hypothetical protein
MRLMKDQSVLASVEKAGATKQSECAVDSYAEH